MNRSDATPSLRRRRWQHRRGAAFLLLVFMLLLVIVAATKSLVTGTVSHRRAERDQRRARMMLAAIDHSRSLLADMQTSLRFPIDESRNERILVTTNDDSSAVTATWMRDQLPLAQLTRPYDVP